ARAPQPVAGLTHHASDGGGRGRPAALCEPQQGETRLRLITAPARLPVGGLRRVELAEQPVNLTLPVPRLRGGPRIRRLQQSGAGAAGLLERVSPRAVELHDLGAV